MFLIYFLNNYYFPTNLIHILFKIVYINFNSQSYVFATDGRDDAQGY